MDKLQLGEYFRDTLVDWFMGKGRRKEKDVTSLPSQESKRYLRPEMLECSSPEYKLREIVQLPEGVNYNEWLASHCLAFFDHINLIYGTISEFCTTSGCPDMIGPNNRLYLWVDEKGKRCKLSAPQYIDYVMTYTQRTVNDESIFPTKFDKEFPSSFESIVKKIMLLLFHVLAHIYHTHFKEIELLNLHPQTNCIFAHFMLFNDQFMLIEEKETEVLSDLAVALKLFPPKPNDKASAMTPTSPKTSDESGNRLPSTPIDPGSFGDTSEEHHHLQQQHQVIPAQCRSISPFINSNNNYSNYGEDMAVDILPENPMDVTITEDLDENVVNYDDDGDDEPCTSNRTRNEIKLTGDDDCCMSNVKNIDEVPLASSSDYNKTHTDYNYEDASHCVHSRRSFSASAILTSPPEKLMSTSSKTKTTTTSSTAPTTKFYLTRRSHSNGSPVTRTRGGKNPSTSSHTRDESNSKRIASSSGTSANMSYYPSLVPQPETVFPMDSVTLFGGSSLTAATATAAASASLSPQQFQ